MREGEKERGGERVKEIPTREGEGRGWTDGWIGRQIDRSIYK